MTPKGHLEINWPLVQAIQLTYEFVNESIGMTLNPLKSMIEMCQGKEHWLGLEMYSKLHKKIEQLRST